LVFGITAAASASAPAPAAFPTVAILCYHDLSSDTTRPLQTVPASFLRAQIRACKAQGWTFVRLSELIAKREHPEALPRRTLVLTFDDAYRSFRDQALPILRAERVPAALAVVSSFVEHPPPDLAPIMTWGQIRAIE